MIYTVIAAGAAFSIGLLIGAPAGAYWAARQLGKVIACKAIRSTGSAESAAQAFRDLGIIK